MESIADTLHKFKTYGLYFWGHVKQQVYSERIMNVQHSIERVQEAPAQLTINRCPRKCVAKATIPLDLCRANKGAHVELR